MNIKENKRNSVVYRKKIKIDINNYNNTKENKNISKQLTEYNMILKDEQNLHNNTQKYNSRNQKNINQALASVGNNNISIKYKKNYPANKVDKNNHKIPKNYNSRNFKKEFISNLLKANKAINNSLPESFNNIKTETNIIQNYIDKNNGNNLTSRNKNKDSKNVCLNDTNSMNNKKSNKLRKISFESYVNNSVFIKKKAKDICLRNKSAIGKEANIDVSDEISNNDILSKTNNNIYINNTPEFGIDNETNQSINNNNININISINNNYLNKDKSRNYKINKINENSYIIKTFDKKKPNKKLIKESNNKQNLSGKSIDEIKYNNNKITKIFNSIDNSINSKLYNLEDFLLIIQKLELIREKLNIVSNNINKYNSKQLLEDINKIRIKSYDLYEFYMGCSIEGKPYNLFTSKISKSCLHYYSVILLISIGLCYIITQKIKTTIDYHGKLLILLNLQEKAFMILCDAIIKKLNENYQRNIWVIKIIKKLNNQLISNADTINPILQIKMLSTDSYKIINDILINIYIFYEKMSANEQEIFLYNHFHNKDFNYFSQYNINELEEIFDKNIFKAINLRSNYANIASLKYSNKDKFKDNYDIFQKPNKDKNQKNESIGKRFISNKVKSPFLKFPPKKEYTLVLDLDETMISFKFTKISMGIGKLHLRPGLEEFLEEVQKYYEIIVFTSGTKDYADAILSIIEQKNNAKYFDGLLYREHTILMGKKYIKDLSKLGRDLSKTIIVDNLPHSFKLQRENGILINSFYGDNMNDKALFELKRILINIYKEKKDVRDSIIKYKEDIIKNVTGIDEYVNNYENE